MTTVGQIETKTQQRIVTLFREQLGYDYLGDWSDRGTIRADESEKISAFDDLSLIQLIIDEHPINPKYYDDMSHLLLALVEQRRQGAIDYQNYLADIVALTRRVKNPSGTSYPPTMNSRAKQALYDNLDKDDVLAVAVDNAVKENMQDGWRDNSIKVKKVKNAIRTALIHHGARTDTILELVKKQNDY